MGEIVRYPSNGGSSAGYLAVPNAGSGPGVIVIQERWGLVPHIRSVADRFADAGFVALAPDLYHGVQTTAPGEASMMLMGLAMDRAAKDIAAAADFLAARAEVHGGTRADVHGGTRTDVHRGTRAEVRGGIGTVGFCAGGSLALWSATFSDRIVATAGFYPALPWERMSPKWPNYAGKAAVIHCDAAAGASGAPGIQTAKQAIEAAGGEVTLYDYAGTHHAFFNDDRPQVYDGQASASAWARTLALFRTRLG